MDQNGVPLRVRKGAWSPLEDDLLRKCVQKHGEGNWHQVPSRAGLNRCRKSCRLRWVNYLSPNIKKGNFSPDEDDLIMRLHRLLGNRWSLIAGRIPGRTGNDIKNYWNTRLQKKYAMCQLREEAKAKAQKAMDMTKVIRPQPRSFSNINPPRLCSKITIVDDIQTRDHNHIEPASPSAPRDSGSSWWDNLIVDMELDMDNRINDVNLWDEKIRLAGTQEAAVSNNFNQEGQNDWTDIFIDNVNIWDILSDEQAAI